MGREITTEITINAPAEQIWNTLMDFENYPDWNPFIKSISGNTQEGEKLKAELRSGEDKTMTFKPKVLKNQKHRHFAWLGKLFLPKIFDGEHHFELIELDDNTTLFKHYERFSGILVWIILKMIEDDTKENFELMNQALKQQVEGQVIEN